MCVGVYLSLCLCVRLALASRWLGMGGEQGERWLRCISHGTFGGVRGREGFERTVRGRQRQKMTERERERSTHTEREREREINPYSEHKERHTLRETQNTCTRGQKGQKGQRGGGTWAKAIVKNGMFSQQSRPQHSKSINPKMISIKHSI